MECVEWSVYVQARVMEALRVCVSCVPGEMKEERERERERDDRKVCQDSEEEEEEEREKWKIRR